jgi:lysophospholipase L1-like esterase
MAVAGYEIRIDGGTPVDVGNVLTYENTGLTPDTSYDAEVRSYDTAGNYSAWSSVLAHSTAPYMFESFSTTNLGIWDLIKRRSGYAGSAVRVERASDNVQADIGFLASGLFDMATYSAFGTGSEAVVKVYDQSGNGFDFEQSDLSLCPIIRTSTWNGKPCIYFADGYMRITGFTDWNGLADAQFIALMRMPTPTTGHVFIGGSGNRDAYWQANFTDNIHWTTATGDVNRFEKHQNGGLLARFQYDGGAGTEALKARLFVNRVELTSGIVGSHDATLANETHLDWNGTPLGAESLNAEYFGFYYIGQDISAPVVTTLESAIVRDYFSITTSNIVCEGDSLTYFFGTGPDNAGAYPKQLKVLLQAETGTTWNDRNTGLTADQIGNMLLQIDSEILVYRDEWQQHDIACFWGGTNDLAGDPTGGAALVTATLDEMESWVQQAFDAGFEVYVLHMLPRTDADNDNPTFEADRASYNSQIAGRIAGIGTEVSFAGIAALTDTTNLTYFLSDQVHLTAASNALIAQRVFDTIQPNL